MHRSEFISSLILAPDLLFEPDPGQKMQGRSKITFVDQNLLKNALVFELCPFPSSSFFLLLLFFLLSTSSAGSARPSSPAQQRCSPWRHHSRPPCRARGRQARRRWRSAGARCSPGCRRHSYSRRQAAVSSRWAAVRRRSSASGPGRRRRGRPRRCAWHNSSSPPCPCTRPCLLRTVKTVKTAFLYA